MKYTNNRNTSLAVAVWLANDSYDHDPRPNLISTTTIIKPIKQIVLSMRAVANGMEKVGEVSELVASRMGTAFHDSIETAWVENYESSLQALGYPQKVIDKVRINPILEEEGAINIYLERRSEKAVGDFIISGKFDMVMEGGVRDFKSTGTYTYTMGTNDEKYILQGSVYRWLNQDIITEDVMHIDFIFTDWNAKLALGSARTGYPATRVLEHSLHLMSVDETDTYIKNKVNQIVELKDAPQADIPACTKEDLWQSASVYKYYKNPASAHIPGKRSTNNFKSLNEANMKMLEDGNVGVVIEVKGEVRACKYCPARMLCDQATELVNMGLLK